jgi:hypothetical protein
MTRLPELFDEASRPPSPGRYTVDDVLAQARRWRRWRAAGVAAAAVLVITAGLVVSLARPDAGHGVDIGGGMHLPYGPVRWVGWGDAQHLYLVTDPCDNEPPLVGTSGPDLSVSPSGPRPSVPVAPAPSPTHCPELFASANGGNTWVSRGPAYHNQRYDLEVLGPTVLARSSDHIEPATINGIQGDRALFEISLDGGAQWTVLDYSTARVPIDPALDQLPLPDAPYYVIDPARHRIGAALADSGFGQEVAQPAPLSAGLWVAGTTAADPVGLSVSVSHDGAATWVRTRLRETQPVPGSNGVGTGYLPVVATRDGLRAYALVSDLTAEPGRPVHNQVFLSTDGGTTWAPTTPSPVLGSVDTAWATADGRLVVCTNGSIVDGRFVVTCQISSDGAHFTDATLPGLPATASSKNGFVAMTDQAMYASTDGFTWHQVWPH